MAELQRQTDEQLAASDGHRVCPATGRSVSRTFEAEARLLRPPGVRPEPFDLAVTRAVQRDGTVNFAGRSYRVPFRLCGLAVEVRGCCGVVQVWHEGSVVARHPRGTTRRLLIDQARYQGEADERVIPPVPLGRMGQRLQEILEPPVEPRPRDLYAALAEVSR